jgi:hypothetical protein
VLWPTVFLFLILGWVELFRNAHVLKTPRKYFCTLRYLKNCNIIIIRNFTLPAHSQILNNSHAYDDVMKIKPHKIFSKRCEVLAAVTAKIIVSWDVTPCSLMFTYNFLKDRIAFFFRVNGGGSTFVRNICTCRHMYCVTFQTMVILRLFEASVGAFLEYMVTSQKQLIFRRVRNIAQNNY